VEAWARETWGQVSAVRRPPHEMLANFPADTRGLNAAEPKPGDLA
jgi:hypothetical protein